MTIQLRLTILNFLQFFVWGAWLITIGVYWFQNKGWSGNDFGAVFSTLGLSSIFMPTLTGIIADRWLRTERMFGILHLAFALIFLYIPHIQDPELFFWFMLAAMCCYMPTLSLSNAIAYTLLEKHRLDPISAFPPIRVWGTIGFVAAMWVTNLSGNKAEVGQFYISACAAFVLGIYAFTLPACHPQSLRSSNVRLSEKLGLHAFSLFKNYKMAIFFTFSMFLGAALQLTNMYGDAFLSHFESYPEYANSLVVKNSTVVMSISQISETIFILAIPFFLKRFGIKHVMLISMLAWVLRFGLLAYSDPADGLWMIILSCIVYGMAFDFFNISGSLFVETTTPPQIRSSAQGLFMMMTNGFGAVLGSRVSGWAIDRYFTRMDGQLLWSEIWIAFAGFVLILAFFFSLLFHHKNEAALDSG